MLRPRAVLALIAVVSFYAVIFLGMVVLVRQQADVGVGDLVALLAIAMNPVSAAFGYWFGREDTAEPPRNTL